MTIELYVFPPSPPAFKVMAVANHLGLDYEIRFLDLPKGTHKTPQYAALNPNMRMPTLKDGDYGNRMQSSNISPGRNRTPAFCPGTSGHAST